MAPNKNQRALNEAVKTIASVIGLMIAIFALLGVFLPTGLVQPVGALVIGLVLTAILAWIGKLDWEKALATWLTASIVLIIVHLIVSRPATIVGSVVDSSGSPAVGLTLVLTDSSGVDHKAVTDENGAFEIKNVPEGKFNVSADGELLISGRVPSGWKRVMDFKIEVGTLVHKPSLTVVAAVPPDTPTATLIHRTNTPVPPTDTSTPEPPTNTPVPELTDTHTPEPTSTSTSKPTNTPTTTPTRIVPGSVLFEENFEDGSADGFVIESGDWQVIGDDSGNKVFEVNSKGLSLWPSARFGSSAWRDYVVEYRVKLVDFDISTETGSGMAVVSFRKDYKVSLNPYWQQLFLSHETEGAPWDDFANSKYNFQPRVWYSMRIEANGTRLKAFMDGNLRIDIEDTRASFGQLSLGSGPNTIVQFDDIRIIALGE